MPSATSAEVATRLSESVYGHSFVVAISCPLSPRLRGERVRVRGWIERERHRNGQQTHLQAFDESSLIRSLGPLTLTLSPEDEGEGTERGPPMHDRIMRWECESIDIDSLLTRDLIGRNGCPEQLQEHVEQRRFAGCLLQFGERPFVL